MDASQRREFNDQLQRSTGSYELVVSPVLLALIGYGLDRWLGTVPMLTVIFAVVGLAGAVTKLSLGYRDEMDEHEAGAPWAKRS